MRISTTSHHETDLKGILPVVQKNSAKNKGRERKAFSQDLRDSLYNYI